MIPGPKPLHILLRLLLAAAPTIVGCKDPGAGRVGAPPALQEKTKATVILEKLDSHILLALKKNRSEPPFDQKTNLDPDLLIETDGRVLVDITATVTPDLLSAIEKGRGQVINSFPSARAIRAYVPLPHLEVLATHQDVQFIAPAAQHTPNQKDSNSSGNNSLQGSSIQPQP